MKIVSSWDGNTHSQFNSKINLKKGKGIFPMA